MLSGRNLKPLFSPDTAGVDNGDLRSVAWSADGRYLYAGGRYDDGTGTSPIRRWSDGGRGAATELAAAENTIMDLKPFGAAGVLFAAADPRFGAFDGAGAKVLSFGPETPDLRAQYRHFTLSRDGTSVRFGLGYGSKRPVRFDLAARRLAVDAPADPGLAAPRLEAPGLAVEGWKDTYEPTLNGAPLALKQYERSRSLAVAPDGRRFLLGTEWSLRLFDVAGKQLWRRAVPGVAWGVNISGDGRVAVAAYGDGTVRWHRLDDGAELLALLVHPDGKRWVLWTPKGYYDAAIGAEGLIGWHVNNGKDQAADFFTAARFRDRFYRPDVIDRVLDTLDVAQAARLADAEAGRKARPEPTIEGRLPPVISILSPAPDSAVSSRLIDVTYEVRAPSGQPVTGLLVLIDGRPVTHDRGLKLRARGGVTGTVQVRIPPRDSNITLIAENRDGASEPTVLPLRWGGAAQAPFEIRPKLYVLAIGVADYLDDDYDLSFAAKDAADLVRTVEAGGRELYRDVAVRLLTDGEATRDGILDGLDWIRRATTAKDVAMVFLAGHGLTDHDGDYYFLPHDGDTARLTRTAVPYFNFRKTLSTIAGKALFFFDTCYAGKAVGSPTRRGGVPVDVAQVANDLSSAENGVVVFASSSGRQFSLEDPAWGNGAFTKALVEGLSGKADYQANGVITVNELDLYLAERVKQLTGGWQTPTTAKPQTVPDFPIALTR